jgi:hypothetical protein
MSGENVRKIMFQSLGEEEELSELHIQTVKITQAAHAKLRALSDLTKRSKTPLAADLLMAAIDDAIESLPNDPLDEATAYKLRGVVVLAGSKFEADGGVFDPRGMRDIALERVDSYLAADRHEQWEKADAKRVAAEAVSQKGVRK